MTQANLHGKKIIIGISGSIAAYKIAELTRLLIRSGAEVQILMTDAAQAFITPLTLSTLSRRPVLTELISGTAWNNHVELGLWADLYLVAPASANTLAKLAHGHCQDILGAVYLSARCPVWMAPAMDLDMWQHPATQRNCRQLEQDGARILPPAIGELASGLTGQGRMPEPGAILQEIAAFFAGPSLPLSGKKALVTAGPTYEPLDPVRFIGNHSSGKMGYAIAEALAQAGAAVSLISGPSQLQTQDPAIELIRVQTAAEMLQAVQAVFDHIDIAVFSAAVADYRPSQVADQKIKKAEPGFQLSLEKTEDIAQWAGAHKKAGQVLVGFALETEREAEHAREKKARKQQDILVLNSLRDAGAGFGHDTNQVTFFLPGNKEIKTELESKASIAAELVQYIIDVLPDASAPQ